MRALGAMLLAGCITAEVQPDPAMTHRAGVHVSYQKTEDESPAAATEVLGHEERAASFTQTSREIIAQERYSETHAGMCEEMLREAEEAAGPCAVALLTNCGENHVYKAGDPGCGPCEALHAKDADLAREGCPPRSSAGSAQAEAPAQPQASKPTRAKAKPVCTEAQATVGACEP